MMDSSPDLSVKLRRGSSDSRDSFYMGFAQGIDSDIEEVTTVQSAPVPPPTPPPPAVEIPLYPAQEEPPIEIPVSAEVLSEPEEVERLPDTDTDIVECEEERQLEQEITELEEAREETSHPIELSQVFFDQIPPPPFFPDEDEDETNTSVTVIQSKNKTPSSSSSSISSALNELIVDDANKNQQPPQQSSVESPKPQSPQSPQTQSVQAEITTPASPQSHKSPPKKLNLHKELPRGRNFDSDSIDSINAIDCKIDDDNRDDSSPTDSMPPAPTPPPLGFPLSLEKSGIMEATSQVLVPSPSSPDNAIVSPESLSHHSSPAKSSRVLHYAQHVTIDETRLPPSLRSSHHQLLQHSRRSTPSTPPPPFQSGPLSPAMSILSNHSFDRVDSSQALVPHSSAFRIESQETKSPDSPNSGPSMTTQNLAVLYQTNHHLHPILVSPNRRQSRLPDSSRFLHQQSLAFAPAQREIKASDAFCTTLSALYGKILVVMGIAFPMAEVISTYIPPSFYEGFYLYLYIGSMLFLFFMYTTLLWGHKPAAPVTTSTASKSAPPRVQRSSTSDSGDDSDHEESESSYQCTRKQSARTIVAMRRPSIMAAAALKTQHYGSFYLRMGAVAFGIGSMIYSGLEFGQYFELERDTKCHNVLLALTPATRMAFIFIQMYFIFLNNEQIKVYRYKVLARFGLMHMIGTNLSVWFSVLIQETKHEILTFYDPENRTLKISHRLGNKVVHHALEEVHLRVARGLKGPHNIFECRRSNILGTLVQDASPFLFPCTIEYSLICAAILYVMWRNVCRPDPEPTELPVRSELHPYKRSPHHYSVDCAGAHKGLFVGILMLVLTIISLIIFFVLIAKPEFTNFAVTEVNICELALYGTTTLATLVGMIQVRTLHYDSARSFSLDDILLVGGQTGSFLYSTFTIIGAHLTLQKNTVLILITAMASLVETAFQTMFILDASRRSAATPNHIRKKPGRELVTFLLVSNLAMWAINTLEKSRAESHPLQLHFYGLWAWTIITHVSMPLAIFYRFHSTVCLCDIWKRAWKMKPTYM